MHGSIHDFVVANTVKDGLEYTTGHGGEALVKDFAKKFADFKGQPTFKKVLEIGSLDVNGSMKTYDFNSRGPRWYDLVGIEEYIGIDLIEGPCVDKIMNGHDIEYKDDLFDLVMCMSTLEHDTDPAATVKEAYRVLKKGQPFIMTTVDETHPEHKHLGGGDKETYNFLSEEVIMKMFVDAGFSPKNIHLQHTNSDVFIYAIK